jgi:hypothetical protein
MQNDAQCPCTIAMTVGSPETNYIAINAKDRATTAWVKYYRFLAGGNRR